MASSTSITTAIIAGQTGVGKSSASRSMGGRGGGVLIGMLVGIFLVV